MIEFSTIKSFFSMSNPGATLAKIVNHIQPALQPFHTRELIEMLEQLECVSMTKFQKIEKASLFSPIQKTPSIVKASILDETDLIFVEPLPDAIIKLSQFAISRNFSPFDCPCHTT